MASPSMQSVAIMAAIGAGARAALGAAAAAISADKGEKFSSALRAGARGAGTGLLTGAAIGVVYPHVS